MRFPKNKGFDLIHGIIITVVLEEITLIGRFLGEIDERHQNSCSQPIKVTVDLNPEFILLQLVCAVDLEEGPVIPIGTIVAVNINQILFVAAGGECEVTDVAHCPE